MRICDICFCELKEKNTCKIKNGTPKDICHKCLSRLESKGRIKDDETLVKEYIAFIEEKSENIEKLIYKLNNERPDKYRKLLRIEETDICCKPNSHLI